MSSSENPLQRIIDMAKDVEAAAQAKKDAAILAEEQRRERERALRAQWANCVPMVRAAADETNRLLADTGIHLTVEETPGSQVDSQQLAQVAVRIEEPAVNRPQLVLNFRHDGQIHFNPLIPHSGRIPGSFSVHIASQERFRDMIADFLEQVLAYRRSKLR